MTEFRQCIHSNQGDISATISIKACDDQTHNYIMKLEILRSFLYCERNRTNPLFFHRYSGILLDEVKYNLVRNFFSVVEESVLSIQTCFGLMIFEIGPKDDIIIEVGKFGFSITIDGGPMHCVEILTTIDPTSFGMDT